MKLFKLFRKHEIVLKQKSVFDLIKEHSLCTPMNKPWDRESDQKRGIYWLNPNDQTNFNAGWFTEQDFMDWMNGEGSIVKGKTKEEKEKFWLNAKFLKEQRYGWMIQLYWKYFGWVNESYDFKFEAERHHPNENPLIIDRKSLVRNNKVVINIFGMFCNYIIKDLECCYDDKGLERVYDTYNKEFWGAKMVLYQFGLGYFAYSNTPEDFKNLSWVGDLIFAKAYYIYLKNKGVTLPDFEFINKNRYKY